MVSYQYFALYPRHDNPGGTSTAASNSPIRIIRLLPGNSDDPLHCVIEHIELRDHENGPKVRHIDNGGVPFDALSYAWGDAVVSPEPLICEETVGIVNEDWPCNCNIPRGKGLLQITENLVQALRALRDQENTRNLWVDAVCIDQSYDPEKLQQIQIMGRIYSQANVVRAWLGPEGDAKLTFDYVRCYADVSPFSPSTVLEVMRDKSDPAYVAFQQLFSRSYFQRRWIIQEVALASDVMCHLGSFELPWDTLSEAATNLTCYEAFRAIRETPLIFGDLRDVLEAVPCIRDLRRNLESRSIRNPVHGMMAFRASLCREDRDRVLSLLNFFSHLWSSPENVQTRFTDARPTMNSPQSVYTFLARWQLDFQLDPASGTQLTPALLDLLSIACVTRSVSSGRFYPYLRSWVPDWRFTEFEYEHYDWSQRLLAPYGASAQLYSEGERRIKWPIIKDPDLQNHLNIPIQLIDYIDTIIMLEDSSSSDEALNNSDFRSFCKLQTVCPFLDKGVHPSDPDCQSCYIIRVPVQQRTINIDLVLILTTHLNRLSQNLRGSDSTADQTRLVLKRLREPWSDSNALSPIAKRIAHLLRGRCIFVSQDGYAGVGNLRVRPGDALVSISRGDPDFVLRFKGYSCLEKYLHVTELISDASCSFIVDAAVPPAMVCLA